MLIQNNNKKVVAVHDLSCIGRVSLNAVIPILTSMGLEVTPLPTALLSCHTQYPDFTFLDLTTEMRKIIANWKAQGFRFNAEYTIRDSILFAPLVKRIKNQALFFFVYKHVAIGEESGMGF